MHIIFADAHILISLSIDNMIYTHPYNTHTQHRHICFMVDRYLLLWPLFTFLFAGSKGRPILSTSSSPTGEAGLLALKASIFYSGYIKSSTLKWTAIALISIYIVPAQGIMGLLNLEKEVCRFCCFPTNEKHQNMSWPWNLFCYIGIDRTR